MLTGSHRARSAWPERPAARKMDPSYEGVKQGHAASRGLDRGGASRKFRAVALAGE
jgi:hypothetical protein